MKNNLSDLNNHLFGVLELLNDEGLSETDLEKAIKKADAVCKVSGMIIANGELAIKAMRFKLDASGENIPVPGFIEAK